MSSGFGRRCGPRLAVVLAVVLVGVLMPATSAFASTVSRSGTDVTWTADGSAGGEYTAFTEPVAGDMIIYTGGDPVDYDDNSGTNSEIVNNCTDNDDPGNPDSKDGSAYEVLCTSVDTITANAGGGEDTLDADCWWFCPELSTIQATFNGGLGADDLAGGDADGGDTLNGDEGNDDIYGYDGDDTLNGGDGDDYMSGYDGDDDLTGGDGDDEMYGSNDDDTLHGDEGQDYLDGSDGDDLVRAGAGDDSFYGGNGVDDANGEDGSDDTSAADDGSVDALSGGNGTDSLYYAGCDTGCSNNDNVTITESGDAAAAVANDDGDVEDDPSNDFNGFENVDYSVHSDARATVTIGGASADSVDGSSAKDTVTPGDGPDFVNLYGEDDTANTADGYPDFVDCGESDNDADVANADQFDDLHGCETVNVTNVQSAYGDPDGVPPFVKFTSPAANAVLPASPGTQLTATASDDAGVVQVYFLNGSTILCTDTTAPYECNWEPTADDVGNTTLSAWAVDGSGQFGAAFLPVTVKKFDGKLKSHANKKDLKGKRTVRASGELELPDGIDAEQGCEGVVLIKVKDGNDTLKKRRADVQEDCSWSRRIGLPPVGQIENDKVKVVTKFLGNEFVDSDKGPTKKTEIR